AAMDAFLLVRLSRIKWWVRPLSVARQSALFGQRLVVIWPIPIAAPFPYVAGQLVKPIAIRWKRFHRRDSGVTVFARIFHRKFSLPRVGHPFAVGPEFIAPHVHLS